MVYTLINPKIDGGSIQSSKKTNSDAAEDIWSKLSSNIKNYTPEFYFTIQDKKSKSMAHYMVKENLEGGRVKYSLKQYKNKNINDKSLIELINQDGGSHKKHRYEHYDDDSSSSSSSELVYTFPSNKSNMLALTYFPTIYGVPNILLPTFSTTFTPFVKINLPIINNAIIIPV